MSKSELSMVFDIVWIIYGEVIHAFLGNSGVIDNVMYEYYTYF